MKTFEELRNSIKNEIPIVWNNPEPIDGNDYTISHIDYIEESNTWDINLPILVQYNNGGSESEIFLHEISLK